MVCQRNSASFYHPKRECGSDSQEIVILISRGYFLGQKIPLSVCLSVYASSIAFSRLLPLRWLAGSGAIDAHAFTIKVAKKEKEKEKEKECGRPTEERVAGE